jgi:hypothetical protein
MITTMLLASALTIGAALPQTPPTIGAAGTAQPGGAQAAERLTPAQAGPFLGDWTLQLEGPNGPGTFTLSVRAEKDTVVADLSSEAMPKQPITEISMAEKTLVLAYTFPWEGNAIDAVVSVTPAEKGPAKAQIDFAGGAYVMSGTATRQDKTAK